MAYGAVPAPEPAAGKASASLLEKVWRSDFGISLLCSVTYMALYTTYDILCARSAMSHGGYFRFEPVVMVFVIEMGKFLTTLVIMAVQRPEETPTFREVARAAARLSIVAVCFSVLNVISLICLARVSLSSYSVWYQSGMIFNMLIWYLVFRTPFSSQKISAMAVLAAGCICNSINPYSSFHEVLHVDGNVFLVVLASLISAIGCVANEYFVKRSRPLELNIMNLILYAETSSCMLVFLAMRQPWRFTSATHFFYGFTGDCYIIAGLSILIGLMVSRILRYASTITKNFVMAVHCPVEVFAAHLINGSAMTRYHMISAVLVVFATIMYYHEPVAMSQAKSSALPK